MIQVDLWDVVVTAFYWIGGALVSLLAYVGLAPTKLGEAFLNHHLERKLEALKHDQNEKIEALRVRLSLAGDRGVRSNEREYEALVAAWEQFAEAFIRAKRCAVGALSYPDLTGKHDAEVAASLSAIGVSELDKKEILAASDRNRALSHVLQHRQVGEAHAAIYDSHDVLRKRGIFIPTEIEQKFVEMLDLLSGVSVGRSMEIQGQGAKPGRDAVSKLLSEGDKMFADLKALVRTRLHADKATIAEESDQK